jgi:antitoxin (DNA-binding transcriptional repressor) of toxin-antitoxin stability system
MKTRSITEAKNSLSQLIYQLESDEPIHLTRHGKPKTKTATPPLQKSPPPHHPA